MVERVATQADPQTVVIDNGTGFTKMGYAGNFEPSYQIPSCIAKAVSRVSERSGLTLVTLDYFFVLFSKKESAKETYFTIQS